MLLPRVEVNDNTYNSKESNDNANNNNNNDQAMDSKNVPRSVLSKILRAGEDGTKLLQSLLIFVDLYFTTEAPHTTQLSLFVSSSLTHFSIFACSGDSTPLTTQAVRDLQRAQKERVFNRTLIKIKWVALFHLSFLSVCISNIFSLLCCRFPDRVSLQGYFHPRDTVQDVYEWVASCLNDEGNGGDNNNKIGSEQWCFELYTSPPRTVLSPHSSNTNSSSKGNKSDQKNGSDAPTLASMGFVPAAVIYLAWKNTNLKASPAFTNSSGKEVVAGGYFLPALLEAAVSEEKSASIPTGM